MYKRQTYGVVDLYKGISFVTFIMGVYGITELMSAICIPENQGEVADFKLREQFPGRYEAIFSTTYLLEVAGAGSGKGDGVLRLARLLGIAPGDVYCAGDNENDLSMLRAAAVSFVPDHSTPIAMENAGVIVCDCDEGALADVVAYLDRKYE